MILQSVLLLLNLLLTSMAGGLIFVGTVQSASSVKTSRWLLGFWTSVFVWATLLTVYNAAPSAILLNLAMTATVAMVVVYHLFILYRARVHGLLRRLTMGLVLLGGIWIGLVWTGALDLPGMLLQVGRLILLAAIMLFPWLAFWAVMGSDVERVRAWRLPTFLVAFAGLLLFYPVIWLLVVCQLIVVVALMRLGWLNLREQLFLPLETLQTELRVTDADLKQALGELSSERQRLSETNKLLETVKDQRTNFLAAMSHELRTPLNSIVGYSELLRSGAYGHIVPQQEDRIEKISRNAENLLSVVTDILDLSKIDAGRLELEMQQTDLAQVVTELHPRFQQRSEASGLAFVLEVDDNLHRGFVDKTRFVQILTILVQNAVRFTPSGSVSIRLMNLNVQHGQSADFPLPTVGWVGDGEWILIQVTDTGMGIAPEKQATIFDAFANSLTDHQREFDGTGLGLTIVRRLVNLHHGIVWIRSRPGEGSTFYLVLPSEAHFHIMES